MKHSIINYKDLGFKTALNKDLKDKREREACKILFSAWLEGETIEDRREGNTAFYNGFNQYYKQNGG